MSRLKSTLEVEFTVVSQLSSFKLDFVSNLSETVFNWLWDPPIQNDHELNATQKRKQPDQDLSKQIQDQVILYCLLNEKEIITNWIDQLLCVGAAEDLSQVLKKFMPDKISQSSFGRTKF